LGLRQSLYPFADSHSGGDGGYERDRTSAHHPGGPSGHHLLRVGRHCLNGQGDPRFLGRSGPRLRRVRAGAGVPLYKPITTHLHRMHETNISNDITYDKHLNDIAKLKEKYKYPRTHTRGILNIPKLLASGYF